ncbi:MAG: response regulator transcription factor [Acidimicrobiia bacterium]
MGSKPKVLIVDDEPDVLLTLRILLEGEGFEPSLAAEGETALRRIDHENPDLLLLDIMMPVLDGWMVLAQLADRPQRPHVVVCSAKTGASDIARARELGAAAYITKPFDPADLVATLRSVLAGETTAAPGTAGEAELPAPPVGADEHPADSGAPGAVPPVGNGVANDR